MANKLSEKEKERIREEKNAASVAGLVKLHPPKAKKKAGKK